MQKKVRKCLGPDCEEHFQSEGIHNRLCPRCSRLISKLHIPDYRKLIRLLRIQTVSEVLEKFKEFLLDKSAPTMYIVGVAGTGKTTSLHDLIEFCEQEKLLSIVCAYTHKAVSVLKEKLPQNRTRSNVCTLHKYLRKRPTVNTLAVKVHQVDTNTQMSMPDEIDVLFIDEFSMIGEKDYVDIVNAQYDENGDIKHKVVYIGDPNQLPPVKDMQSINPSGKYCVYLKTIYRQSNDNPLLGLLSDLNNYINGETPKPLKDNASFIRNTDIIKLYKECKTSKVILAYTNACVESINSQIQGRSFPEISDEVYSPTIRQMYNVEVILPTGECDYIHSVTNELVERNSKYKTLETLETLDGVEFGMFQDSEMDLVQRAFVFGHNNYLLKSQSLAKKAVNINKKIESKYGNAASWASDNWQDPLAMERAKCWREYLAFKNNVICLDFKHAMTVHKSQGSTYETVFLDIQDINKCSDSDYKLYLKLLYVAISRASEKVYTN